MLLLVVGIMAVTALVLMLLTKTDLEKKMLEVEEKSVGNVIYLIKLNIEDQYKSFLFHKLFTLEKQKNQMRNLASVIVSGIDRFYQMYESGLLQEQKAKSLALDWTRTLRYDEDAYFFVYDKHCTVLSHPNHDVIGKNMSSIKNMKGLPVFESMMNEAKTKGGGFTIFSWDSLGDEKDLKKFAYFTFFSKWQWMIATASNLENVELDAQERLDLIVKDLKKTFKEVRIAESGYLFLFNGKKEIIIHPSLSKDGLLEVKNPVTGHLLVDDLMAASQHPEKPTEYLWAEPSSQGEHKLYESYVSYFKTLDWYIASSAQKDEIRMPAKVLVLRQLLLISIIFIIGFILTYFLVKKISEPLRKLTEYAKELPKHDFTSPGHLLSGIEELPVKYKDEVGKLAESFLFMEDALRQYIINLQETTAAKERIESELKIAHDIQMGILPKIFPPFPDRSEFDIYATIEPAKEVGGDLYDFFFMDDYHLYFAIGDVSGKGVPASLFMAVTKTLIKAKATQGLTPQRVLSRVNQDLSMDNPSLMFVTLFLGILNIRTGELEYSNGGHNPPYLIHSNGDLEPLETTQGLALGVMDDFVYQSKKIVLQKGDTIFLYTDGVTEAMNEKEVLFSEQRLEKEITVLKDKSIEEFAAGVMEKIREFSQEVPQTDDITMMLLRFFGQ
jgi:sigma-B regulation protein RsbU (phosphoserine phosphatase)